MAVQRVREHRDKKYTGWVKVQNKAEILSSENKSTDGKSSENKSSSSKSSENKSTDGKTKYKAEISPSDIDLNAGMNNGIRGLNAGMNPNLGVNPNVGVYNQFNAD